jgi:hypothetical protein
VTKINLKQRFQDRILRTTSIKEIGLVLYLNSIIIPAEDEASWWDAGTAGVFDIGDMSIFLTISIAFCGVIAGIFKLFVNSISKIVEQEIKIATAPIHPSANGGLSLADVARKADLLEKKITKIDKDNQETRAILIKVLTNSVLIPDHVVEEAVEKPRTSRKKPTKKS